MPLTFDPAAAVAHLKKRDRDLGAIIRDAGPFTLSPPRGVSPFESLLRAIVSQQLSGKAAATILGRVHALFESTKKRDPEALLALSTESLRAAGLSGNKVLAVRDLAAKTIDGTVPTMRKLRTMSDEEVVERLVQVRGIGVWSAEMLLMFSLGRPDVLPVADLGVRQGFMFTYALEAMPTVAALTEHAEKWRPYRSVASWYMWRAVELSRRDKAAKSAVK